MQVVVLGADGMVGHMVLRRLSNRCAVIPVVRRSRETLPQLPFIDPARVICGIDLSRDVAVRSVIELTRPDVVVNCAGIIKQRPEAEDARLLIRLNAMLPHELAELSRAHGFTLIHISTDCVFSGSRGRYSETDRPDPNDLYACSKLLGEPSGHSVLTVRTSVIGRELTRSVSLLEWFLGAARRGEPIRAFSNVFFSGLTTGALADELCRMIETHAIPRGTLHIAGPRISKALLLATVAERLGVQADLTIDPGPRLDRSLDDSVFRELTGTVQPSWEEMVDELARDAFHYDRWRSTTAGPLSSSAAI